MAKVAKSWGHKVKPLADDEARDWSPDPGAKRPHWTCAKCKGPPSVFAVSFLYVTGKAGRVTDRWQAVCVECARKFAAKNGVPMPDAADRKGGAG